MKSNFFLNQIVPSFMLFVDHELLKIGEGFTNYSGNLYQSNDPDFKNYNIYGSPFRQWVSDSSIPNAYIPSGVYNNGNYVGKGTSGINVDYGMGRIIAPNNVNLTNPTINYAFKDINVYYTDAREEKILFDTQFSLEQQTDYTPEKALNSIDRPYPCMFVKLRNSINDPYAFGGLDQTNTSIRCVVLADSNGLLDSVISIFNDTARKVFSVIPNKFLPYNVFGDIKSGIYNYEVLNTQHLTGSNITYIDKVLVSKFDENVNRKMGEKVFTAFIDFELSNIRSPRRY